jgi:hypothetical protein
MQTAVIRILIHLIYTYYPEMGNAKSTSVAKCILHHLSPYSSSEYNLQYN